MAGDGVRSIADISRTASDIARGDLSQRINTSQTKSELGQLAVVLNDTEVPSGAIAAGVPAVIKPGRARVADIEAGVASYLSKSRRYRDTLRRIG